jgi:hypothetical protein
MHPDEPCAGDSDYLRGAEQIARFLTELLGETSASEVYYLHRVKKLPIGQYGKELIASKTRIRHAVQAMTSK